MLVVWNVQIFFILFVGFGLLLLLLLDGSWYFGIWNMVQIMNMKSNLAVARSLSLCCDEGSIKKEYNTFSTRMKFIMLMVLPWQNKCVCVCMDFKCATHKYTYTHQKTSIYYIIFILKCITLQFLWHKFSL